MSLESASYAVQLSASNPTSADPRSEGDDHLRVVKTVVKNENSKADKQWIYTGDAVTRQSTSSFTLNGDQTGDYVADRRIKLVGSATGTVYGDISSSTYTASTVVQVTLDSGSLQAETLTSYLHALTTESYPRSSVRTGFIAADESAGPGTVHAPISAVAVGTYAVKAYIRHRMTSSGLIGCLVSGDSGLTVGVSSLIRRYHQESGSGTAEDVEYQAYNSGAVYSAGTGINLASEIEGFIEVTAEGRAYVSFGVTSGDIENAYKGSFLTLTKL